MTIHAWAAPKAGAPLEPFEYDPAPLGPHDLEIRVTHCGMCHSDLHLLDNDWQMTSYPFVPGHEVVGTVSAVGELVGNFRPGQRVGIGWQAGSCHECEQCRRGEEQFCAQQQATCVGKHGGYADAIRVDSRFAFHIPEGVASEDAGPLFCGGVTVFSPLIEKATPGQRVGVIGIGGLGHMALQFAAAMGCEVTAFSHSPGKEEEARGFGAHHFVAGSDKAAMGALAGKFDLLISSATADLPWADYMNLVAPRGELCVVGAAPGIVGVPSFALIMGSRALSGSQIGSPSRIIQMLDFCALHGVKPQTEVMPIAKVNDAMEKVRSGKARYRMVLEV